MNPPFPTATWELTRQPLSAIFATPLLRSQDVVWCWLVNPLTARFSALSASLSACGFSPNIVAIEVPNLVAIGRMAVTAVLRSTYARRGPCHERRPFLRHLGSPVDYVVFDGFAEGQVRGF